MLADKQAFKLVVPMLFYLVVGSFYTIGLAKLLLVHRVDHSDFVLEHSFDDEVLIY